MRVTDSMQLKNWLRTMQKTSTRLEQAQTTLASGKGLQKPSDDPSGTSRAVILKEQISRQEQYILGIDDGTAWLKTADTVLGLVSLSLSEAQEIALQGANASTSPEQRLDLSAHVSQIIEHMVGLANAQYAGNYIFSGEKINVKPFALNSDKTALLPYAGGSGSINRQVQGEDILVINHSGQELFVDSHIFDALFNLKQALADNNHEEIQNAYTELTEAFNKTVSQRAMVGSKINRLGEMKELHELQKDHFKSMLWEIEEGDLIEVITTLNREQLAYEAAMMIGVRINNLSLLDFMR